MRNAMRLGLVMALIEKGSHFVLSFAVVTTDEELLRRCGEGKDVVNFKGEKRYLPTRADFASSLDRKFVDDTIEVINKSDRLMPDPDFSGTRVTLPKGKKIGLLASRYRFGSSPV
ncbi:MAG: hypothetical protein HYY17_07465 [Planctomycetes bacterium]|nr:hypothetical protein [Planctomycetota bacterium]